MTDCFKRDKRPLKYDEKREVNIGKREENLHTYPQNYISTTKYNLLTFMP